MLIMIEEIKFTNYSKISNSKNANDLRFDWCVFMEADTRVLDRIEYVKYILHPTFINPERISKNKKERFAIYSNGWGTFSIKIEVVFKNKEIYKTDYYLVLKENAWPTKNIRNSSLDIDSSRIYSIISDSNFDWRKKSTIALKSHFSKELLEKCLDNLEHLNFIRKAHYKSIDNQELYGVTSKVGIHPEL